MTNHHSSATPAPGPARSRTVCSIAQWCVLVLLIAGLVYAWGTGIVHRQYDYDEVQRAHSIWLASRGLRPYHELFEVHPPYFVLLTPIFRWWPDPCAALRA